MKTQIASDLHLKHYSDLAKIRGLVTTLITPAPDLDPMPAKPAYL